MGFEQSSGIGVDNQRYAEGIGDALRGDVIMRRPDPAGGKDIVKPAAHIVHGGDNDLGDVGDHARLAQPNTDLVEAARKKAEILVLGAAR